MLNQEDKTKLAKSQGGWKTTSSGTRFNSEHPLPSGRTGTHTQSDDSAGWHDNELSHKGALSALSTLHDKYLAHLPSDHPMRVQHNQVVRDVKSIPKAFEDGHHFGVAVREGLREHRDDVLRHYRSSPEGRRARIDQGKAIMREHFKQKSDSSGVRAEDLKR